MYLPSYLTLYKNGDLEKRVAALNEKLLACNICPHLCGINRTIDNSGICNSFQDAYVCSYCDHHGEEPPLSGTRGSGTIFFGNCNLKCNFCQNADISQHMIDPEKFACTSDELARLMIDLQDKRNCHNINFVSPSHFVPQIVESINKAILLGLKIPLVYNSNGYDNLETLKHLDGIIDIYLPDLKYANNDMAKKYSGIPDYVDTAYVALKEMYRQVGLLEVDHQGIAQNGLIIRHLVLPNNISGSRECLRWIAHEISVEVTLSLMAQYYPSNRTEDYPELAYPLDTKEYFDILQVMKKLGFVNALYQETRSALLYRPDFEKTDDPFH